MTLPLDFLVSALVTLFVVVDPVGLTPAFIGLTAGLPRSARRQVALRACLIAFAILAGSALIGDWLLRMMAISLPAFRIAGGLLLFSIASEMVFGLRVTRQAEAADKALEEHVRNIAAFPLAIPLMAGPGAITATVLLAGRARRRPGADRAPHRHHRRHRGGVPDRVPRRRPHRARARRDRQHGAVTPARRAAGRARRAVRDRRREGA